MGKRATKLHQNISIRKYFTLGRSGRLERFGDDVGEILIDSGIFLYSFVEGVTTTGNKCDKFNWQR